jgi:hypothetical protein
VRRARRRRARRRRARRIAVSTVRGLAPIPAPILALTPARILARILALILPLILGSQCEHPVAAPEPQPGVAEPPEPSSRSPERGSRSEEVQQGYATWYGGRLAGHRTANGERYDPRRMTAAHRTLPFGTWVEVTCIETGRRVRVRITDRGPFGHADRIIDLSRAAADQLGIRARGLALVALHVVAGP